MRSAPPPDRRRCAPFPVDIPNYRLYLQLSAVSPDQRPGWTPDDILDPRRRFPAVVDTGASMTSLPHHLWRRFEADTRWLARVDDVPIRFGGETYPYRLGRVLLAAIDLDGRWLPPDWALVRCLSDAPNRSPLYSACDPRSSPAAACWGTPGTPATTPN